MKRKNFVNLGCVAIAGMACLCGKSEKTVVVVGSDSLKIEKIRAMMAPDIAPDSIKMKQAVLRYSLANVLAASEKQADSAASKFCRRMTLLSGAEWSPEAAAVLLNAGAGLEAKIRNAKDIKAVLALVDSLAAISGKRGGGTAFHGLLSASDRAALATMDITDKKLQIKLFSMIFGISEEQSATLSNFVRQESRERATNAAAMVKDLLAAPVVATKVKSVMVAAERTVIENPTLALKFRSQQSIRDSIQKHLPDLQQLYKKQLKTNEMAGGVVWVVFRVDAGGKVLSTAIKSSQIDNRQFLQGLRDYAHTIQFKTIPETVGPMTFEFPFEFKPEL
jgi:hypothetical protein